MRLRFLYYAATFVFLLALLQTFEGHAYAYADPGSSLLLFQGFSAVFTGGLFLLRRRFKQMVLSFRGRHASKKTI